MPSTSDSSHALCTVGSAMLTVLTLALGSAVGFAVLVWVGDWDLRFPSWTVYGLLVPLPIVLRGLYQEFFDSCQRYRRRR